MEGGKNSWNVITMQGGSGRAVVPWGWCQVAGSPAAAAGSSAAGREGCRGSQQLVHNWSTAGQDTAEAGPAMPAAFPCGAARTISSLRRPRESVKAQRGGHTTASWCQQFENREEIFQT